MAIKCGNCKGSHDKAAEVRGCYGLHRTHHQQQVTARVQEWVQSNQEFEAEKRAEAGIRHMVAQAAAAKAGTPAPKPVVEDGFYTVVFPSGSYRTLRVKTQEAGAKFAPGEQIVSFLSGSDNESDYTGFAFLKPDGRTFVWKRFKENGALALALNVLTRDPEAAGQEYSLRSNRCRRCNRTLTVPASINRGYGPVCDGMVA